MQKVRVVAVMEAALGIVARGSLHRHRAERQGDRDRVPQGGDEDLRCPARRDHQRAELRLARDQPAELHQPLARRHPGQEDRRPGLQAAGRRQWDDRPARRFYPALPVRPGRRILQVGPPHEHRRGDDVRGVPHPGQLQRPARCGRGLGHDKTQGMRSATLWTTGHDTKNRVMYYHTQHNRRVRKVELSKIDFARPRDWSACRWTGRRSRTSRISRRRGRDRRRVGRPGCRSGGDHGAPGVSLPDSSWLAGAGCRRRSTSHPMAPTSSAHPFSHRLALYSPCSSWRFGPME